MTQYIEPKILQGTRDFLPADMAKRDFVMNKIKSVFVNFGYDTIETPVIEYAETILGKYGDDATKLVYRFNDNGGRDVALRYDQTVPFARVVAANYKNLPMPFKRYQISRVWRADRPGKGRYREFYQCDVDIIGTTSLLAETEIASVMSRVFTSLGFPNFVIKFNSRRLINSILTSLDVPTDAQAPTIRILDKIEKIGAEEVVKELTPLITQPIAQKLISIVSLQGTTADKLTALKSYDIREITEFVALAKIAGIPEANLLFEPSLARGLDYYTGIIYEVFIPEVAIGAVCSGGRYDNLCAMFTPESMSGVGVGFGFDRIVLAMEELNLLEDIALNSKALVTYQDERTLSTSIKLVREIQNAGISAEMYFEPAKLAKQIKYATKKNIPFVVVCNPDDVTIKVMQTGKQKNIPQNQVADYFKGIISL